MTSLVFCTKCHTCIMRTLCVSRMVDSNYSFRKRGPINGNSQRTKIVYSNPLFFSPSSSFLNIMKDNIYSQTFIQNIPQALRSLKFSYCNCHLINMKVLINQQQQNLYIEVMILISIMMMLKLRTKKNSKKKKGETIIKGQKNGCHFFFFEKGGCCCSSCSIS